MNYTQVAILIVGGLELAWGCVRVKQAKDRRMYHKVRCETMRGCYVEMGMEWRARRSIVDVTEPAVIPSKEISRLCDSNGDAVLEEMEYRRCFTVPAYMSEQTFKEFDSNRNGQLEDAEASSLKIILSDGADCYKAAIKQCTVQALLTFRATYNMYNASQEYAACLANKECSEQKLEAYSFTIRSLIDDLFSGDSICGLGINGNSNATRCSKTGICHCSDLMVSDLREDIDLCDVISSLRECIQDYTFGCEDDISYHARSGADAMVQVYSQMGLCQGVTV